MRLFDSHCHLDDASYNKDIKDVIKRAIQSGVEAEMVVGINLKSSLAAISVAEQFENVYTSVGVHPHDVKNCTESVFDQLKTLAENPKVRAWGEAGLDFNRMFSPREDQEKWFVAQLEAADTLGLPVILHERDSNGRFLDILKSCHTAKRTGVVHCFSGNKKELFAYLDLGYHIGMTGIITIKTRGKLLRELAPMIPADRILIETDAPYLTPAPQKNKTRRNEPAFVLSVLQKLAEVRNADIDILSETIWQNTCRLYQVSPGAIRPSNM